MAQVVGTNSVSIVGDTMTVHHYGGKSLWYDALKVLAVRRDLVVCVAGVGVITNAQRLDTLFAAYPTISDSELAARLAGLDEGEFLVVSIGNGARIVRIRDGQVETPAHSAWIGDLDAFNVYQQAWHTSWGELDASDEGWRMLRSMEDVLGSVSAPTVGGATTRVATQRRGFQYIADGSVYFGDAVGTPTPRGITLKQLVSGSSFTVQRFVPIEPGVAALGLWFPEGALGYLFAPGAREPRARRYTSPREFGKDCEQHCGVGFTTTDPLPRADA